MKISFGAKAIEGPFGGGNEFLKNLKNFFEEKGHQVVTHLNDVDIDIILLTNPLVVSQTSTFNNVDIDYYLKFKNPNAIVFQRINECDERKGTNYLNSEINYRNKGVDLNIFVSEWLRSVFEHFSIYNKKYFVIKGGPNEKIYNIQDKKYWNGADKIKLVTHHWSSNPMKGFKVYKEIDSLLNQSSVSSKLEFTFIGNLPKNLNLKNTKVIDPLVGNELAEELKKHHVYVTASINEPSGNHHMEGALCGLPIMYVESGALPEYCSDYGVAFEKESFLSSLKIIQRDYQNLISKLKNYPYSFSYAAEQYEKVFIYAVNNRAELINQRIKISKVQVVLTLIISVLNKTLYKIKRRIFILLGKIKRYIQGFFIDQK